MSSKSVGIQKRTSSSLCGPAKRRRRNKFLMGNSSNLMLSTINFCTAQIVGDTERPKETDASSSRRFCRFLLTIMAIIGLTASVTISLVNQPPKRSQRHWIKQKDLNNMTGFIDRMAMKLNSADWQCPCKATGVVAAPRNEARLVEFLLIDARHHGNVVTINSIEQFCSEVSRRQYFAGFNDTCMKLLKGGFRLSGWDFSMRSSNLYMNSLKMESLNPIAFMFDVCTSWAGGLSQVISFFLISHIAELKEAEARRLNTFVRPIRILLDTCSKSTSWPPPDQTVYLAEANKHSYGDDSLGHIVAMRFNWTQYFTVCAPSYCEHLENNSSAWILFNALAQVGGFVSVALFAIRSVVWPLICKFFGWPTCFETRKGEEDQIKDTTIRLK